MDYYEKTENPTPRMTEIAKNLKIDDNPIVIIAKLKEKDNGAKWKKNKDIYTTAFRYFEEWMLVQWEYLDKSQELRVYRKKVEKTFITSN